MKRGKRISTLLAGVLLLAGGIGWGSVSLWRHLVIGTVVTEDNLSYEAEVGQRFSLAVHDRGPSVGDIWSAEAYSADLLDYAGRHLIQGDLSEQIFGTPPGGGSGTRYFSYTAKRAGTASVVLTNCFRGCASARDKEMSRTVTWTITVK